MIMRDDESLWDGTKYMYAVVGWMSRYVDGKRTLGSREEDRCQDLSSRELRLDFSRCHDAMSAIIAQHRVLCRHSSPTYAMSIVLHSQWCRIYHLDQEPGRATSLPEAPSSTRPRQTSPSSGPSTHAKSLPSYLNGSYSPMDWLAAPHRITMRPKRSFRTGKNEGPGGMRPVKRAVDKQVVGKVYSLKVLSIQ